MWCALLRSKHAHTGRIDALSYNQGNTYSIQTVVWIITCINYSLTSGKTTFCSGARADCDEARDWRARERERGGGVGKEEDARTGCFLYTLVCLMNAALIMMLMFFRIFNQWRNILWHIGVLNVCWGFTELLISGVLCETFIEALGWENRCDWIIVVT